MSSTWNSGRLRIISATRAPRASPSAARPDATRHACSAYRAHVSRCPVEKLASEASPARSATVETNAPVIVAAPEVIVTPPGPSCEA
jgi:hypothetical protein